MRDDPDHFTLLGLPAQFALDRAQLDTAWRDAQAQVHPDRFATSSPAERRVAMQWASRVNEAYRVLRSPLERARYLCERAGQDLQVETNTAMAPGFLMQQMEWRESLDDARASRQMAPLDALADDLAATRGRLMDDVAALLDQGRDFAAASARVREWMFIEKFSDEIDTARDRLADSH
jgi:molecular chaperone HscB